MGWQRTLAPASVAAPYWSRPTAQLLAELRSAPSGLTAVEARGRLAQAGPNLLQANASSAAWRLLLRQFSRPLVLILLFAASVSAFLRFFDAPKAGAREAIATLARLGVAVKVISGDNRFVTAHVAALVGLPADRVVTGARSTSSPRRRCATRSPRPPSSPRSTRGRKSASFLPLLAKQILLNNFRSDFPAVALAGDRVDPEYIAAPHRWDMAFIRRFMIVFGLVSSAFDALTFWLRLGVAGVTPAQFRTGWFVESLLTELLVALMVRTRRPFFRSRPSAWLLGSTVAVALLALALPYLPGATLLGFVPLPIGVLALIVAVTLGYVLVVEATKHAFYARAGAT